MDGSRSRPPSRQLVLDLTRDPGFGAEDFLVSASNAAAFGFIDLWPDWPMPTLVVLGPPGSGKSHLAAIWARRAAARIVKSGEPIGPEDLASHPALVIEDCDRAGLPEADLFHILNMLRERGRWLMLTARKPPNQWGLATPDLLSRLRLSPIVEIGRPDGPLIRAVLVKLFADRQIRVDEDIVAYATLHLDQSLEAVTAFVAAIDEAALAAGRRITRPLAIATIAALQRHDP